MDAGQIILHDKHAHVPLKQLLARHVNPWLTRLPAEHRCRIAEVKGIVWAVLTEGNNR